MFCRTLLRNRKLLKGFFYLSVKAREKKVSRGLLRTQKQFTLKNSSYEYTTYNILIRSHFCLFLSDALVVIRNNFLYVNGICVNDIGRLVVEYDCVQLRLSKSMLHYIKKCKRILRKKVKLIRRYNWWY